MKNSRVKHYRTNIFAAFLLVLALWVTACGSGKAYDTETEGTVTGGVDKSVYMDPSVPIEERITALLSQMTLEEKVAQMVQAEQSGITAEDIATYGIGSVLSGGGSAPSSGNTAEDWSSRVNELKAAALETRLGIPLLYGVDAVHGNNNVYGATVFPHNIGLGAANDPGLMEEIGAVVASEVRATGIQWTFAPTLGNPQNVTWGRTYECFSERAEDIAPLAAAYVQGLQGTLEENEYMAPDHIIACAKHFIGEGYTTDGVNQGDVDMSAEEFDALLASGVLDPYAGAINAGVLTVMASYNSVDGVKCHENRHLLQEVLKDELGFQGLVVSDYNAIEQTSGITYTDQVEICVNAGIDLFMEPFTWKECMEALINLVNDGRVTEERIDDAVTRILRVKFTAGLFEEEIGGSAETQCMEDYGSQTHRELARRAVRESLVLLKNDFIGDETAIERLAQTTTLSMVGQKAYDIGSQCGGWTISWQGSSGNITQGTSIIDGIYAEINDHASVTHSVDGSISEDADAVIAVFGEVPYAESDGDRDADSLTISAADKEMLNALRENLSSLEDDVPVVGIVIAGRPIDMTEYMDMFDAIVMAWLPGTEGEGIADVLFGEYDFSGTIKYTWMKDMDNIDVKETASEDLILFPYGYGLNKKGEELPQ